MTDFEIQVNGVRQGKRFSADVDPKDGQGCTDLLRAQASARGIRLGTAELVAFNGRYELARWRAT